MYDLLAIAQQYPTRSAMYTHFQNEPYISSSTLLTLTFWFDREVKDSTRSPVQSWSDLSNKFLDGWGWGTGTCLKRILTLQGWDGGRDCSHVSGTDERFRNEEYGQALCSRFLRIWPTKFWATDVLVLPTLSSSWRKIVLVVNYCSIRLLIPISTQEHPMDTSYTPQTNQEHQKSCQHSNKHWPASTEIIR
jgi:hypothetical protein